MTFSIVVLLTLVVAVRIAQATTANVIGCAGHFALVTGATGKTGRIATKLLLEQGYCVRVFTRNETRARLKLAHLLSSNSRDATVVEFFEGELGDGASIRKAFAPRVQDGATVSRVLFLAGGDGADYGAVNHRGVAECAAEAMQVGAESLVVVSAAWVSKPYSLASLLFNSLYPSRPMALHLLGEEMLRREATSSSTSKKLNYVIIRAGRLVGDEEYPKDAPSGLTIAQGDSFGFFGPAGIPGICSTQLAHAAVAALQVEGQYTVEMTSGSIDRDDPNIYRTFVGDGDNEHGSQFINYEDIMRAHERAVSDLRSTCLALCLGGIVLVAFLGWKNGIILSLLADVLVVFAWSFWWSDRTIAACIDIK